MISAAEMVSDAARLRREARERRREERQRFLEEVAAEREARLLEREARRAAEDERERKMDPSALTFLTPAKLTLLEKTFGKLTTKQRARLAKLAEEWRLLKSEMLSQNRSSLSAEECFRVGSSLNPTLLNQCGIDCGDGNE